MILIAVAALIAVTVAALVMPVTDPHTWAGFRACWRPPVPNKEI